MSKGEKGVKESSLKCFCNRGESECLMQMVECRNASVAINAKGGDCWQIQWTECSECLSLMTTVKMAE
jgi:hypothetical protein